MTLEHEEFSLIVNELIEQFNSVREPLLKDWKTGAFDKSVKNGGSPITHWDLYLDKLVFQVLSKTPYLVVSEERLPDDLNQPPKTYWIVDPLDGTVEFVDKTEHFAINVALIHDSYPVWGLIYHPVSGSSYYLDDNRVAHRAHDGAITFLSPIEINQKDISITLSSRQYHYWQEHNIPLFDSNVTLIGASLKYLALAQGEVTVYPRNGVTGFWDTAAGQVLVEALGGYVIDIGSKERFCYTSSNFLNNGFIVASSKDIALSFLERYQSYF